MAIGDSSDEILELAISKEMESYHFYMALARHVDTAKMRDVFEELAQEELEHKAKLELEIIKMGKVAPDRHDPAGPDSDYILSSDEAPLNIDYKDMLLLAMEKEEASFRTYVDLVARARNEQARELLLALAEEEVKHKLRFKKEYHLLLK
jgi:rubrerythrin